jgi:hypothetical protein
MGNYVGCYDPTVPRSIDAPGTSERIGSNGAGGVFIGYLLAAYVIDRRPEMQRAARWLRLIYERDNGKLVEGWPEPVPYSCGKATLVEAVQRMVDFNYVDHQNSTCGVVDIDYPRIKLGLKFKRPKDPLLDDIGVMFERYAAQGTVVPLEPERVRRIAELFGATIHYLEKSCWFEQLSRCLAVFQYGAERGWPVHVS